MEQLAHGDRLYTLRRFPLKRGDRLRAWDAADAYILRYLAEQEESAPPGGTLLINDTFGALGVALHDRAPVSWGDSFLGRQALRYNLCENRLAADAATFVPSHRVPDGSYALVLIKLPKSLALFEDQLLQLRQVLAPDAQVVTGGMIKHTPSRAYRLLAEIIGPTTTSQGWKKARLAHSRCEPKSDLAADLAPATFRLPGTEITLCSLANVFSREKPDVGTRLLLDHLPQTTGELAAVDLGCGNGILAVALALACPRAEILGVDESYQAVTSAQMNAEALGTAGRRLRFCVSDGLADEPAESRDLVVCNPPFHQGQTTGDLPAWTLFREAHRVLRPGGEMRVVGNRHLGYHAKLKRLYGRVELVASDAKFVVLSARKGQARQ